MHKLLDLDKLLDRSFEKNYSTSENNFRKNIFITFHKHGHDFLFYLNLTIRLFGTRRVVFMIRMLDRPHYDCEIQVYSLRQKPLALCPCLGPKKMCVYCHMSKKSRVGRSGLIFFIIIISKTGNSRSRFRNPIPAFHFRNFW